MITRWKLFNFKAVREQTELELGAITLFAGTNSSGKSTWLQSILLVTQSLMSTVRSRSVILNGSLVRLGQFSDLRSAGSRANHISVGWECKPYRTKDARPVRTSPRVYAYRPPSESISDVSCEITFDIDAESPERDLMQLQPRLTSCLIRYSTLDASAESLDAPDEHSAEIRIKRTRRRRPALAKAVRQANWPEATSELALAGLSYSIDLPPESDAELSEEYPSAEPVGCAFRHFLPERVLVKYDVLEQEIRLLVASICDRTSSLARRALHPSRSRDAVIPQPVVDLLREHLGDDAQDLLGGNARSADNPKPAELGLAEWYVRMGQVPFGRRAAIQARLKGLEKQVRRAAKSGRKPHSGLVWWRFRGAPSGAISFLEEFFSGSVRYLGPLRDEPKPIYPLSTTADPTDVGLRGEYTAAVLDLNRKQRVTYVPSSCFGLDSLDAKPAEVALERAVSDWLRYLEVAEGVDTKDLGKLGHELKVTAIGTSIPHDLTHVGVGVSQLLPILVACLLARPGTVLIFEQPELHLHPSVQARLGDFFLSMGLLGKQCIIETHSEYLIDRFRLRAALSSGETISDLIRMYFVEQTNGAARFRRVLVNKYGAIRDWPAGFFDQSQREAERIVKAALAKRRREPERTK